MATLTRGQTFASTEQVTAAKLHALVDSGSISGIVNADLDASAAIVDTKLAQITTANKVSGTALTGLASIASGAGVIPNANCNFGSGSGMACLLVSGTATGVAAKLPAVDGSSLIGISVAATTGMVIQTLATVATGIVSGGTTTPCDNSIPQVGEGNLLFTQAITPQASANSIEVEAVVVCGASTAAYTTLHLHKDGGANAVAAAGDYLFNGNADLRTVRLLFSMVAGSTASASFTLRGGNSAGNFYMNGINNSQVYLGKAASTFIVREIKG